MKLSLRNKQNKTKWSSKFFISTTNKRLYMVSENGNQKYTWKYILPMYFLKHSTVSSLYKILSLNNRNNL